MSIEKNWNLSSDIFTSEVLKKRLDAVWISVKIKF